MGPGVQSREMENVEDFHDDLEFEPLLGDGTPLPRYNLNNDKLQLPPSRAAWFMAIMADTRYVDDGPEILKRHFDMVLCVIEPWIVFTFLLVLFLFYRDLKYIVWCFAFVTAVGSVVPMVLGAAARHGSFLLLGASSFASVFAAAIVGLHVNDEYINYYYAVHDGNAYKNVDPSHLPARTIDAGVFQFTPDTFVDDRRTIGFVAAGSIHCVAPVAKETLFTSNVHYWATGVDCCEKRSNFDCGTAMHHGHSEHPQMAIVSKHSKFFDSAVKEALSVYNLTTPADTHLVSFVQNPVEVQDRIYDSAVYTVLVAVLLHLFVMGFIVNAVFKAVPAAMVPRGGEAFLKYYLFEQYQQRRMKS